MVLTDERKQLLQNTFKNNEELMIALRIIFLPEYDPESPIGSQIDLWLNVEIDNLSNEEAIINIKARNLFLKHMEGGLIKLKQLADATELTPTELKEKMKKDSSK